MRSSRLTRRLFQGAFWALTGYDHPVTLDAGNADELERRLAWIDDRVPPRSRRTRVHQDHKEWYCARRYLLALVGAGRLSFPLTVRKGQSPDFTLHWSDGSVTGIEIAEATTEAFQRALAETEGEPGAHALGPEEGWEGDALEQEVADAIVVQFRKKIAKIGQPHWRTADRHDVLIYGNGGWIAPDLARVTELVRERLPVPDDTGGAWPNGPVGSVSLLHGRSIVIDLGGTGEMVTLDSAWT